ncbi:MAG: helix-turn-helix transcriptional regulator, partial [Brevinematales bacterium]
FISAYFIKKERRKSITILFSTSILLLSYLIYMIQNKLYIFSLSVIFVGQQDNLAYGILLFVITNTYYLYTTSLKTKTETEKSQVIEGFVSKYNLSNRERDILRLLVQRYSYKEIARDLFISNKTVETHIYHIYQKTGSKNKTELIDMVQIKQ